MDEYEQWEAEVKKLQEENEGVLKGFQDYLERSGLSEKTIRVHVGNIEFFGNDYLTREDPTSLADGWSMIDEFLGYYFVRKCMWSSPATTRQYITSFKKFYAYYYEVGGISKETLEKVKFELKEGKEDWIDAHGELDELLGWDW
ncbi:hypothetical protein [Persicobacter diffluens]|uniref:Recombinase n=1 Tax=Persicobacter diffluens TaxID=981 RepID=A0AAN4VY21_9BACT|nr:hypothetical protein PEDI_14520 [Persicobacter diffluens]